MSFKLKENVSCSSSPSLSRSEKASRSPSPSLSMVYHNKSAKNEKEEGNTSSENDVVDYIVNNYPPSSSLANFQNSLSETVSMVTLNKPYYTAEKRPQNDFDTKETSLDDDIELKKIRRRMKNKISAQESRRRKKEYVDMLEHRLKQKDSEKDLLQQKVTELEEKIRTLVDELFIQKRLLQHSESGFIDPLVRLCSRNSQVNKSTQAGACLSCFRKSINQEQHSPNECEKVSPVLLPPPLKKTLSPFESVLKENNVMHNNLKVHQHFDIFAENHMLNETSFRRETTSILSNYSHSIKRRNIDNILENKFSRRFSPNSANSCMLVKEPPEDCSSATCSLFLQLSNTDHITSPSHT